MDRTLELTIRLNNDNPCGFVIDAYEYQSGLSAGTYGKTLDEHKEQLWNEVLSWVYLMQEEQEEEESEEESAHYAEMLNEQEDEDND